jgi:FkbM family methyltransferase
MKTELAALGDITKLTGTVVHGLVNKKSVSFFVANPLDEIQKYHNRCAFFEPDELSIMGRYVFDGAICVDIGANVGNHALFLQIYHNPKEIILFEVNPEAIAILRLNAMLNHCRSWNTDFLGFAMSDSVGRVKKRNDPKDNLGATGFLPDSEGAFPCIAGDTVLAHRRIDFIKIDVEGGEMLVLGGLKQTITTWRPIVFVELGDYHAKHLDTWLEQNSYIIAEKFERYPGLPNFLLKPA